MSRLEDSGLDHALAPAGDGAFVIPQLDVISIGR